MKFYRVDLRHSNGESGGFRYCATKQQAAKTVREWCEILPDDPSAKGLWEEIDVRPTRAGILEALNAYASHNDNG